MREVVRARKAGDGVYWRGDVSCVLSLDDGYRVFVGRVAWLKVVWYHCDLSRIRSERGRRRKRIVARVGKLTLLVVVGEGPGREREKMMLILEGKLVVVQPNMRWKQLRPLLRYRQYWQTHSSSVLLPPFSVFLLPRFANFGEWPPATSSHPPHPA